MEIKNIQTYYMEWDGTDLPGAVKIGFHYIESKDEIVRYLYLSPVLMKRLVLELPDEVKFEYIYEGIGMIRTAYIKYKPSIKENELRFLNQGKTQELRVLLKIT